MPRKDTRRSRGYSAAALQELFEVLEHRSYFDLAKRERKTVDSLTQACGIGIDAWTFVLHPAVIEALQPASSELTRYIFTIDTLRSRIYFRIKEFLLSQKIMLVLTILAVGLISSAMPISQMPLEGASSILLRMH